MFSKIILYLLLLISSVKAAMEEPVKVNQLSDSVKVLHRLDQELEQALNQPISTISALNGLLARKAMLLTQARYKDVSIHIDGFDRKANDEERYVMYLSVLRDLIGPTGGSPEFLAIITEGVRNFNGLYGKIPLKSQLPEAMTQYAVGAASLLFNTYIKFGELTSRTMKESLFQTEPFLRFDSKESKSFFREMMPGAMKEVHEDGSFQKALRTIQNKYGIFPQEDLYQRIFNNPDKRGTAKEGALNRIKAFRRKNRFKEDNDKSPKPDITNLITPAGLQIWLDQTPGYYAEEMAAMLVVKKIHKNKKPRLYVETGPPRGVYAFPKESVYSNYYPIKMTVDIKKGADTYTYTSKTVEHFYQAEKFEHGSVPFKAILAAETADGAKFLANNKTNPKDYGNHQQIARPDDGVMLDLVSIKAAIIYNNPFYEEQKKLLLKDAQEVAEKGMILVEDTTQWGDIGWGQIKSEIRPDHYLFLGSNKLGRIWMAVLKALHHLNKKGEAITNRTIHDYIWSRVEQEVVTELRRLMRKDPTPEEVTRALNNQKERGIL